MLDTFLMVDSETLSTEIDVSIVSLGACMFDPRSDDIIEAWG